MRNGYFWDRDLEERIHMPIPKIVWNNAIRRTRIRSIDIADRKELESQVTKPPLLPQKSYPVNIQTGTAGDTRR
jgi:hypothetical protein